jgi:probable blue pigment (indigoidine) exporter
VPGVLLALGAAILFGVGTVLAKRHPLALPPITSVAWQASLGTVPVALLALSEQRDWSQMTPLGWGAVAYISTLPLTAAYLAWFRALRLVPASMAATTVLLSPIVGVVGSTLMLGESLGVRQIVALILTLTGVALSARS